MRGVRLIASRALAGTPSRNNSSQHASEPAAAAQCSGERPRWLGKSGAACASKMTRSTASFPERAAMIAAVLPSLGSPVSSCPFPNHASNAAATSASPRHAQWCSGVRPSASRASSFTGPLGAPASANKATTSAEQCPAAMCKGLRPYRSAAFARETLARWRTNLMPQMSPFQVIECRRMMEAIFNSVTGGRARMSWFAAKIDCAALLLRNVLPVPKDTDSSIAAAEEVEVGSHGKGHSTWSSAGRRREPGCLLAPVAVASADASGATAAEAPPLSVEAGTAPVGVPVAVGLSPAANSPTARTPAP
mmetsp:Transcript_15448/g.39264  ORF Transcript_15448/g.39264 Transcript_15448/m.39264 type:complete len:306 (-) Transcript_15448:999-1916(-)